MLRMLDHQQGPVISISINSVSGIIATLTIEQIRLYSINGDLISYVNLHQQQQHHQQHHQQQQQQQFKNRNTANVMNEPTVILVTPCLLGQDGIKVVTGHKGGYIYLWKLRKYMHNYDESINSNDKNDDNGEHGSSKNNNNSNNNNINSSNNNNNNNSSSSSSSKNKIHSYKTIKNESQLLELFITSIPTRTHKASITILKLCSSNYTTLKSKEIISRTLEDKRYLDLLVGDNDGYVSRWSTLKLDQLTSFDLLSIISDI